MLLEECLKISAGQLGRIEQLARNAKDLQQEKGDWIGCAVALLRLGDRCREVGKLGPARRYCEQARRLFNQHSFKPEQGHNAAVATYALGLVNQLSGDEQEALNLYKQALSLFERAQRHWRVVGNKESDKQCELVSRWINKLIEYVSDTHSRGETTALQYSVFICPWLSDVNQTNCLPAELRIQEYLTAREARIGDRDFELYPTSGTTLTLKRNEEYYIVEAPEQGLPDLSIRKGDYVLVKRAREVRQTGPAVIAEDKEPLFGQFKRQLDGTIYFITPDPNRPPRIIDGPDDLLTGIIVGSLKPA